MSYPGAKFPKPQRFRKLSTCQVEESATPAVGGRVYQRSVIHHCGYYLHWLVGTTEPAFPRGAWEREKSICYQLVCLE